MFAAVAVSGVYPRAGAVSGGAQVRLFGSGFVPGATTVTIGGTAASVTYVASTELLVTVPAGTAGTADVIVTTPGGSATLPAGYTYVPPPTVAGVDPRTVAVAGGQNVVITGTGFVAGETTVTIGGVAATDVRVVSGTTLACTAPAHAPGSADIVVTTPGGTASLSGAVTYFAPPAITGFTPLQGLAGTVVTISGTGFDPDRSGDRVLLGSVTVPVVAATPTQLTVTIPTGAQTGRFTVTTAGGSATSGAAFVVPVYTRITATPAMASLEVGDTLQLRASGVFADNSDGGHHGACVVDLEQSVGGRRRCRRHRSRRRFRFRNHHGVVQRPDRNDLDRRCLLGLAAAGPGGDRTGARSRGRAVASR